MNCFRRLRWFFLLAVALASAIPQLAYADAAPRWTDAQLAGFSDVIVRGRVTRVAVAPDTRVGALYTYVTLDVSEVVKGPIHDRQIIIKQLGGRSGSTALEIGGQPTFGAGEDVVVFLEARPRDGTLSTTALWQGKFTIGANTTNGEVATRQDPGGQARGLFGDQSRLLNTWMPFLRRERLLASTPESASINWAPQEAGAAVSDDRASSVSSMPWRDLRIEHQAIRLDAVAPGRPQLAAGGEQEIRRAAEFWTAIGAATLSTGGLQPSGCFTTRDPDGRISVGVDLCGELNPRGGTLAIGGRWVRDDTDGGGESVSRFLGGGVITNGGEFAARFLDRSRCFEALLKHEIGHTLGLIDAPDGAGIMAPSLECDRVSEAGADARPMFVPLASGASPRRVRTEASHGPGSTNLAYSLSGSTLTLTWTAAAGEVASYLIRVGSMPDQADVANFFVGPTVTSLTAAVGGNAVFYVRVTAFIRFHGQTDPSNEIAIVIGAATPPPLPPSGLIASVAGTTVTLGWTTPTGGQAVTSYIIQAGSDPGGTDLANFSTGNNATLFSASGVPFGTYFVRVRTANGASISTPSNEVQLDVINACTLPGPPASLAASVTGSNVTLTWVAGTAASSYQLQAGSSPGFSNLVDRDLLSPATSFSAANVSSGTYFVRVRSNNACGQSAPSNETLLIIR